MYIKMLALMEYDIDPILDQAKDFIMNNSRKVFDPYYALIEDFTMREKLPLAGGAGIALACGESRPMNILYEIYSDTPYKTALDLTNELFALGAGLHVYMRTDIKHVEMSILIDTIEAAKIYRMERFNLIKLTDIIDIERAPGWFGGQVNVFSPLVHLMTIYRHLYSPVRFTQDPKLLERAAVLRQKIIDSNSITGAGNFTTGVNNPAMRPFLANYSGLFGDESDDSDDDRDDRGDRDDRDDHSNEITGGKRERDRRGRSALPSIEVINAAAMDEFSEFVLVGELAAEFILGTCEMNNPPRIQFISDETPDIIAKRLRKIVSADVTWKQYGLFTDFQLVRTTFFVGANSTPCMDVYNCSRYEMIPWTLRDDMRVGNAFVIARFLCIEIFSMKVISAISKISFKRRLEILTKLLVAVTDLAPEFQLENYAGVYLAENIQKKKVLAEADKPPPYFPEMGLKKV